MIQNEYINCYSHKLGFLYTFLENSAIFVWALQIIKNATSGSEYIKPQNIETR